MLQKCEFLRSFGAWLEDDLRQPLAVNLSARAKYIGSPTLPGGCLNVWQIQDLHGLFGQHRSRRLPAARTARATKLLPLPIPPAMPTIGIGACIASESGTLRSTNSMSAESTPTDSTSTHPWPPMSISAHSCIRTFLCAGCHNPPLRLVPVYATGRSVRSATHGSALAHVLPTLTSTFSGTARP